jgi:cytochrome c oxidase subunit II
MPDFPLFPERASTLATEVDHLALAWLGIGIFFTLLIAVLILFFFVRFRQRTKGDTGHPEHASYPLEITWSVIPLGIALVMFGWGTKIFFDISRPPANAAEYFVTAKQWMWKIQHPSGAREINDLHIPVGVPIKLTMTSEDVIHSFYVPAFRVKQDVLPGRYTTLWFEATRPGRYHLFCAEYCGAEHSQMGGWVYVMEPDEYAAWLGGGPPTKPPAEMGADLFGQLACNTCHKPGGRGPLLQGLVGSEVHLASGRTLVADESYVRESILNPGAKVVAGYQQLMPTYQGQVSEEQLGHLVAYIKSLSPAPAAAGAATSPAAGAAARAPATNR